MLDKRIFIIISILLLMYVPSAKATPQHVESSYDYQFSVKYPGIHQSLFLQNPVHTGTEIAQPEKRKTSSSKKVEDDTVNIKNNISIRESTDGERVLVCLDLNDYDVKVEIIVYNMLGKKVYDVYSGPAVKSNENCPKEYEIPKGKLPDGLYLCVAQSEKFRIVGKFVISR